MSKKLILLTCALALSTSLAEAQSGTREQQDACRHDATRHCRRVLDKGDMVILQCLKDNARKLTRACTKVLVDAGQL